MTQKAFINIERSVQVQIGNLRYARFGHAAAFPLVFSA
jgi:hypothetical protein